MSSGDKASPGLTIDRAAFLLLRVKKAFKKKKQQRKEKRRVLYFHFVYGFLIVSAKYYDTRTGTCEQDDSA